MASHTFGSKISSQTGSSPLTATVTEENENYTLDMAMRATQTMYHPSGGDDNNWTFRGTSTAAAIVTVSTHNYVKTVYRYSAEALPFVETISPQLLKHITEGKGINLTSLLIPNYSLAEFIKAFLLNKILCILYTPIVEQNLTCMRGISLTNSFPSE